MAAACKLNCPKIPIARKFCFCVSVRRGVLIFGYFYLIFELLALSLLLMVLSIILNSKDKPQDSDENSAPVYTLANLWLLTILIFIQLIMTVIMLVGAHKNKKSLLKFYLYLEVGFQLLNLWMDLRYFDYQGHIENSLYFFSIGLHIYLQYLVYSMIRVLDENVQDYQSVQYQEDPVQNI